MNSTILIANWNGRDLLEQNLGSVVEAARFALGNHRVVLVDNASTDDSVTFVTSRYPGVEVLPLKENGGIGAAYNAGAGLAQTPVIVCLAADIRVRKDFLDPILAPFGAEDTFAVAPKRLYPEGKVEVEELLCFFNQSGFFEQIQPGMGQPDTGRVTSVRPTWYAPLAAAAFRLDTFVNLGGFDPIFSPAAFWGEHDLSYRAWKRGFSVLYQPASMVTHTFGDQLRRRFTTRELDLMNRVGRLILMSANLTDLDLLKFYVDRVAELVAISPEWQEAFSLFLAHKDRIENRRLQDLQALKRSDRDVLAIIGGIHALV